MAIGIVVRPGQNSERHNGNANRPTATNRKVSPPERPRLFNATALTPSRIDKRGPKEKHLGLLAPVHLRETCGFSWPLPVNSRFDLSARSEHQYQFTSTESGIPTGLIAPLVTCSSQTAEPTRNDFAFSLKIFSIDTLHAISRYP